MVETEYHKEKVYMNGENQSYLIDTTLGAKLLLSVFEIKIESYDFNAFLETAREFGEEYINDIVSSGTDFALKMKDDLIRRSDQLANGDLTREDFEWLLKSNKELIEMKALEKKGLSVVQLNRIQDAAVGSLVRVVMGIS